MISCAHVIFTKYLPATDTKGSRITARFAYGPHKVTISFPYELGHEERHMAAAQFLIEKRNPSLKIISSGDMPGGMVFTVNLKGAA